MSIPEEACGRVEGKNEFLTRVMKRNKITQTVAKRIDSSVKMSPLSLRFDIRFVHSPRINCGTQVKSASLVEFIRVRLKMRSVCQ